jgi:peptide chain release factor 1
VLALAPAADVTLHHADLPGLTARQADAAGRLLAAEQERQAADASAARRSQVGGGGRSEKIRTYNVKENRVTDHRIGLTIYKLDRVLAGDLDLVVEPLVADARAQALAEGSDGGTSS